MPRSRPSHPGINAWMDARVQTGHVKENTARVSGGHINAMARRLEVDPLDLPADAVAQHFAGRKTSPNTVEVYNTSLSMWRRWLDLGAKSFAAPREEFEREIEKIADPELADWARRMHRRKAKLTQRNYVQAVARMVAHAECAARDLTADDFLAYIDDLDDRQMARKGELLRANTVRFYRSAVRAFHRFAKEQQRKGKWTAAPEPGTVAAEDIVIGLDFELDERNEATTRPIARESLKFLLDCAEVEAQSPDPQVALDARRVRTLLLIESTMGWRIHEAHSADASTLHYTDARPMLALAQFKRGQRQKPLVLQCSAQVEADIRANWQDGGRIVPEWWSVNRTRTLLTSFGLRHGVIFHTHQLRARFATDLYRQTGNDIMAVKRYMRHKDIRTTQRYIHLDDADPVHLIAYNLGADLTATPPVRPVPLPGPRVTVNARDTKQWFAASELA